jgi:hypothetical protein
MLKAFKEKVQAHNKLMAEVDRLLLASRELSDLQREMIDMANECITRAKEITDSM